MPYTPSKYADDTLSYVVLQKIWSEDLRPPTTGDGQIRRVRWDHNGNPIPPTNNARMSFYETAKQRNRRKKRRQIAQQKREEKQRRVIEQRTHPLTGKVYATRKKWRRSLEGHSYLRNEQLRDIYARHHAICYHCRWWVSREEASREHLLPVSLYPLLAKDIRWIVLSHKECNR